MVKKTTSKVISFMLTGKFNEPRGFPWLRFVSASTYFVFKNDSVTSYNYKIGNELPTTGGNVSVSKHTPQAS